MSVEKVTEVVVFSNYSPSPIEEEARKVLLDQEGVLAFVSIIRVNFFSQSVLNI